MYDEKTKGVFFYFAQNLFKIKNLWYNASKVAL